MEGVDQAWVGWKGEWCEMTSEDEWVGWHGDTGLHFGEGQQHAHALRPIALHSAKIATRGEGVQGALEEEPRVEAVLFRELVESRN